MSKKSKNKKKKSTVLSDFMASITNIDCRELGDLLVDESEAEADENEAEADESEAEADESEAEADENEAEADESDADESVAEADESEAEADESDAETDESDAETDESEAETDESEAETDESESEADESESEADESESEADESEAEADESEAEADESETEADESGSESVAEPDSDAWRKKYGDYLLIDVGNSAVKFGLFARERLYLHSMLSLSRCATDWSERFQRWTAENEIQFNEVEIHLSSVCPELLERVSALLGPETKYKQWDAEEIPIATDVENRQGVGTDRLLAALLPNSIRTKKYPILICNCGTALTLDVVSPRGVFLGGQIVPGLETGLRALHENTAYLPLIDDLALPDPQTVRSDLLPEEPTAKSPKSSRRLARLSKSSKQPEVISFANGLKWAAPQKAAWFIGRNTRQALSFGAVNAACGIIERTVRLLKKRYQRKPVVFLSGGAAEIIRPYLTTPVVWCDNLVLRGLWTALRASRQD